MPRPHSYFSHPTLYPATPSPATPLTQVLEKNIPNIPFGRAGEPKEIASVVAFLLSDDASYTSGTNIRVAGGRQMGSYQ